MYHTHLSWCPCHSEMKTVFGVLASSHFLLMFEKPTINARTWLDVRCNFSLAPIQIQMGPHFIRQKRLTERLGPKKSKMAAVFVQERNATSILVMSVSSWCEGHRRRQELNETSFCKFKCKKFRKFSRKSLLSDWRLQPSGNSKIYVLLKSGNWRAMPLERAWVLKGNLL